jgi:hypothetical protein
MIRLAWEPVGCRQERVPGCLDATACHAPQRVGLVNPAKRIVGQLFGVDARNFKCRVPFLSL